jgi:hypothetical protein
MAKAHFVTADGSTVNFEGTPTEIVALLRELKIHASPNTSPGKTAGNSGPRKKTRVTVNDLFDELIGDQFFKKPKGLGEVRTQLANLGHHYPVTTLSGPLQGYVKKRKLRRFKQDGKYVYAQ